MREKEIEEYLVKHVRQCGGKAYKFLSPGNSGVPDRLVVFPNGVIAFIELKAPGEKTRPVQDHEINRLRRFGHLVAILDSKAKIDSYVKVLTQESARRGAKTV